MDGDWALRGWKARRLVVAGDDGMAARCSCTKMFLSVRDARMVEGLVCGSAVGPGMLIARTSGGRKVESEVRWRIVLGQACLPSTIVVAPFAVLQRPNFD